MKAIAATLALALTATFAAPADAQLFGGGNRTIAGFAQSSNEPILRVNRRQSRVERFDSVYPNSGLSRAAKIAIVINDESADTSTERRLPQRNRFANNPSLGQAFGFQSRQPRSVRASRQRSGNYVFLRRQ